MQVRYVLAGAATPVCMGECSVVSRTVNAVSSDPLMCRSPASTHGSPAQCGCIPPCKKCTSTYAMQLRAVTVSGTPTASGTARLTQCLVLGEAMRQNERHEEERTAAQIIKHQIHSVLHAASNETVSPRIWYCQVPNRCIQITSIPKIPGTNSERKCLTGTIYKAFRIRIQERWFRTRRRRRYCWPPQSSFLPAAAAPSPPEPTTRRWRRLPPLPSP